MDGDRTRDGEGAADGERPIEANGWHATLCRAMGEPAGDKLVIVRTESPYLRLEVEATGLCALPGAVRRERARRLLASALKELSAEAEALVTVHLQRRP